MPHQIVWTALLVVVVAVFGTIAWRVLRARAESLRPSEIEMDASDLGGLTDGSALRFRRLVHEYFERRGIAHEVGVQSVDLTKATDCEYLKEWGLTNLAQSCAQTKRSAWKQMVEEHFDAMYATDAEQDRIDWLADDWDRISSHLAVRIYAGDTAGLADPLVPSDAERLDFEGTISCLVVDLPISVHTLRHGVVARWNRDKTAMFEVALSNVWRSSRPTIERISVGGDECTLFEDQSFFTATHALMLERHPECLGSHGSLIGIPTRHVAIVYAIENLRVVQVIQELIPLIKGLEERGPGSISPFLYYRSPDGRLVNLPYVLNGSHLAFGPPESFIEVLNSLQP